MRPGSRATNTSFSGASKMKMNVKNTRAIAQYNADARLLGVFEQSVGSGKSFDYSKSVESATESVTEEQITAYLSTIQRGGLIQSFGCMLAIEEPTFRIIAYSENSLALLGFQEQFESLLGIDVRSLFTPSSASSLAKAVVARDISLFNPICIHSKSTGKPFYAILHRIDVGIVLDLEPAKSGDPALSIAGAVQSQKLAIRAVSRLQLLPGGDVGVLCDTVAEIVRELTGYDRVMVYRFHEDEHGEVVSEVRRSDFEPYLGLHYPAIDIPQACRFLFKQNKVRMICDCHANPVRVIQDDELRKPLCLVNSTLRSPHDCHTEYMASMDSIASLVMAVIINGSEEEGFSGRHTSKLWGLVACHHSSARYVPFPLRYACEFLMQAFGLQLNMELQMATQLAEKKILRIQTFLCDMLLRDFPFGIVTQSPSIMDLVKCDGAALYYGSMCWLLGVTPTETQIKDIAEWLLTCHSDVTGLSTDSLVDAGYRGAASLGDAICGMASARITSKDFLFWFRSHTAREIKWGGARHYPKDKDDGGRMNPRASFKAFLEVVKSGSLPWENSEINAIHSLQLILRVSFQEIEDSNTKVRIRAQLNDAELRERGKLSSVAGEMVKLTEMASVPIFAIDSSGVINGWNAKVAELTGLPASEAMGKLLVRDLVHDKYQEVVDNHLCRTLSGEEVNNLELKLKTFSSQKKNSAVFLVSNACSSKDHMNNVVGVSFVGQDIARENIVMDKFIRLQEDYTAVVQSLNPLIPPIFASDENTYCTEWNAAMEKLSGWSKGEVNGKLLPGEIFGGFCHLKCQDALTKFRILLYSVTSRQAIENFPFAFFDRKGKYVEVLLTANKRTDVAGHVIGCFCFLQTSIPDLQQALEVKRHPERTCFVSLKELAYIRQEMKNPINGIRFNCKLLEDSGLSEDQKQILETSSACGRQMMKILEDMDLESIENGYMELDMSEFLLGTVMDAIVSQVMILLRERGLQLIRHIPEEIKTMSLCGDQDRLQQVLADFWLNIVHHSPSPDGWVEIEVASSLRQIEDGIELVHLQFRMTHPGKGFPPDLIQDIFHRTSWASPEGLGLSMCRKLLEMMNGQVEYIREPTKCYFLINIELCTSP